MNLNAVLRQGVDSIMKTAGRYYLSNKAGRRFLAETLPALKRSAELREQHEAAGTHIPVFLIASVASQCNLRCAGCYARTGGMCTDSSVDVDANTSAPARVNAQDLSKDEWSSVFAEASELGVSFVLMAGGEPLLRQDVIHTAAEHKSIIFPIFTNGTMIDDAYLSLFEANRNLIPVVSIEGDARATDNRRGEGTYQQIEQVMASFKANKLLFGASITVTRDTLDTVVSEAFLEDLRRKGCGLVIFVEYVPTEAGTEHLALSDEDLARLEAETNHLRERFKDTVILSFPGDEEALGGCLASGRGFFHINPKGGAEPCPFSPYSKHNVRAASLKTVLQSKYFSDLRDIATKAGSHTGGCTLFTHENEVKALCYQE